jgi:hypothetical protein
MAFTILRILLVAVFTIAAAGPLTKETPSPRPAPEATAMAPDALFSRRLLRRARLLIEMRLQQLRDDRLECMRQAILRRLPPDLRPTGTPGSKVKQSPAPATTQWSSPRSESEDC